MNYARIRVGATVCQDMSFWHWPRLHKKVDPDMVFEVAKLGRPVWDLTRHGYGLHGGDGTAYGNGAIGVYKAKDLRWCKPPKCEACGQELPR